MGATRQGLEKGITDVRKAIADGYQNRADAYKLLADAYNVLALVYVKPDSEEQKKVFRLQKEALEEALALSPGDAQIRLDYARVTGNPQGQIAALRELQARDPKNAEINYMLGILLIHDSKFEEGVAYMEKSIELSDAHFAKIYGRHGRQILLEKGRKVEAAALAELTRKKTSTPK